MMNDFSWMPWMLQYGWMAAIVVVLLLVVLACALIRWLWNSLVSDLFPLRRISLWESFKILLLCMLLFGGPVFYVGFDVSETAATADGTKTVTYGIGSRKK